MERGVIRIQTPVGALECEVELEQEGDHWVGTLLARPGVAGMAQVSAPTRELALQTLTELAQREHEAAVEQEMKIFGRQA